MATADGPLSASHAVDHQLLPVAAIYPDSSALSWVTHTPVDRAAMQTRLGLDTEAFRALQAEMDAAFDQQRFGWPNVWLDRPAAEQFLRHT